MVSLFQELFCQKCLNKGMYSADKAPQDNCKKCRKPKYFQKHLAYCEVKCTEYSPDEVIKTFLSHRSFDVLCVWKPPKLQLVNCDIIFRLRPWRRPPHWPHQKFHHQRRTPLTWAPLETCSNYWFRPIPGDTRQYCIFYILIVEYNCDCNQR